MKYSLTMKKFISNLIFSLFLVFVSSTFVWAKANDSEFLSSINDSSGGKNFQDAIQIKDACDFSQCKTIDCAEKVFNQNISIQEEEYVEKHFGKRGVRWELNGQSAVSAYVFAESQYYDDLSIQDFKTGKIVVLHFDITSSVSALKKKVYSIDPWVVTY